MQIFPEIIPLDEARVYLSERFSDHRTKSRLDEMNKYISHMSDTNCTLFRRILALEEELDARFEPDELMRSYFTPFNTKENIPDEHMLSIGGLLLSLPGDLKRPFGFDDLIEVYRSWTNEELMDYFLLRFCIADRSDLGRGAAGCMALADKYLTNTEDKWRFMDAVTNPFPHLERLRPLVEGVADYIKERSADFEPLLHAAIKDFNAFGSPEDAVGKGLRVELGADEFKKTELYLSLIAFNTLYFVPSIHHYRGQASSPEAKMRLTLGVIDFFIINYRNGMIDQDEYIALLKLISDPTRFKVLRDLCDKNSFGLELAEKYKTSRGTMYYHLEKLRQRELVDLDSGEYRMLFTMNKQNVYDKLNAIRDYLLNGWKPEESK